MAQRFQFGYLLPDVQNLQMLSKVLSRIFTAALLVIVRDEKQPNCRSEENPLNYYNHEIEFCAAIKKNIADLYILIGYNFSLLLREKSKI